MRTRLELETPSGPRTIEVTGHGDNRGQVASDANCLLAYQRAFDDYLANLAAAMDEWAK